MLAQQAELWGFSTFIVGARVLRVHMCVCVCELACLLARSPSGFHEACSEDTTDMDETEEVINLCCIVHWLTKGKSTECRDTTPVRLFHGTRLEICHEIRCAFRSLCLRVFNRWL